MLSSGSYFGFTTLIMLKQNDGKWYALYNTKKLYDYKNSRTHEVSKQRILPDMIKSQISGRYKSLVNSLNIIT